MLPSSSGALADIRLESVLHGIDGSSRARNPSTARVESHSSFGRLVEEADPTIIENKLHAVSVRARTLFGA